jgi:hypothetical protein
VLEVKSILIFGKNLNVLYGEIPLSFIEIYKEKHGLKFSINNKEYDFSKK